MIKRVMLLQNPIIKERMKGWALEGKIANVHRERLTLPSVIHKAPSDPSLKRMASSVNESIAPTCNCLYLRL